MVLQVAWLRKLFSKNYQPEPGQLEYVPIYALGNVCIGASGMCLFATRSDYSTIVRLVAGWMIFWNREQFGLSQLLVSINSLSQLYAVSQLPPMTPGNRLTHWVAKTTAGIGLLDFFDNGGVAAVRRF